MDRLESITGLLRKVIEFLPEVNLKKRTKSFFA